MKIDARFAVPLLVVAFTLLPPAHGAGQVNASRDLQPLEISVDGATRQGLLYVPAGAKTEAVPVVFVFHGHGGSARQAALSFDLQRYWPEAIVVYLQGLKTPGQITDPQGERAGWQAQAGDQNDRDLKFFDAVLARLKQEYRVDEKRIYVTGHSNGGSFTYLLWAQRGDVFAAVAPSAAVARYARTLKPKPALLVAGEKDPLVKFSWQKMNMEVVRQVNGCATEGKPWNKLGTIYDSKGGTPLVTLIHSGGHELDRDAVELMVRFFKEHPRS